MEIKKVVIDFESRSMCNLKKAGAYKYSLDPTTQPTCLAIKVRGGKVVLLDFKLINQPWAKFSLEFREWWSKLIVSGYLFTAHNAFFERCIYENVLVKRLGWPHIPFEQYRCTAAKAAACALPRNLEGAGEAMKLSVQKDKMGYVAMMATCKPTKHWNAWAKKFDKGKATAKEEPPVFLEPHHNPRVWEVLYKYCKIDVLAEEKLDDALPDLIPSEQKIWQLNQEINWRGLRVDVPACEKIVQIMAAESKSKLKELDTLTMGLVTSPHARKSILEFLSLEGIELPDIRAKTVEDVLKEGKLSPDMKRLLEIRKALSKTSTKKYQGMLDRAGKDHRVRDILLYHGASTGRDSGTGIQPHNFPRGAIRVTKDHPYAAVENVIECDAEMLRILYGENLSILFSSILRNMIMASEGCELFVADFSKIEVAVLWWLANNKPGIKILKSGKDPYKYMAAANKGCRYEDIKDEGDDRQLGKAQVLGCGFGMGWEKFKNTAWEQYRLTLTDEQSKGAVNSYRTANASVPALWKSYELAAISAIEESGTKFKTGRCVFYVQRGFLWVRLPSGRALAYRSPRLGWRETDYGAQRTIEFLGLDKSKKKLALERTWGGTLTENIVQATARDLMMPAMVRLEKAGYKALLSVHDEGLTEKKKGKGSLEEFTTIMCEKPSWSDDDLVVEAKGWTGPRYRK